MQSTHDLFLRELQDTYDAEHQFYKAMEDMRGEARDDALGKLLDEHLSQTQAQIKSLEEVFAKLGAAPKRERCDGAIGIVTEGKKTIREAQQDPVRDTAIADALEKTEHYEMAGYQNLINGAKAIGNRSVTRRLEDIFHQEESMAQRVQQASPKLLRKAVKAEAAV